MTMRTAADQLNFFECTALDAIRGQLRALIDDGTKNERRMRQSLVECVALLDNLPLAQERIELLEHARLRIDRPVRCTPHATSPVICKWSGRAVDIDVDIVPLIKALWACDIQTAHSCQGEDGTRHLNYAYVMVVGGSSIDRFLTALNWYTPTKLFIAWPAVGYDLTICAGKKLSIAELTDVARYAVHYESRISSYNPPSGERVGVEGTFHFRHAAIGELERVFTEYAAHLNRLRNAPTLRKRAFGQVSAPSRRGRQVHTK